ncbi:hypothetical protein AMTRI_Chr08g209710 [Amborella trichopoda]|uniref:Ubiquinol-cytochrome c reductase complex 6.7 kDa protein n=1 Tax=Amborella trichopoda TaxID=13333 RepID=W1P2W9_AMBTC|nr:hypothetical protein AMTR_s00077p00101190 [Amborella trichopoda]
MAGKSGLMKSIPPRLRPQSTDITAAMTWGIAATAGAIWLIQPFDWLKKQFSKDPES